MSGGQVWVEPAQSPSRRCRIVNYEALGAGAYRFDSLIRQACKRGGNIFPFKHAKRQPSDTSLEDAHQLLNCERVESAGDLLGDLLTAQRGMSAGQQGCFPTRPTGCPCWALSQ